MSEQPEALRMADQLDRGWAYNVECFEIAAELRRLAAIEAQRDALLEALNQCLKGTLIGGHTHNDNGLEVLAQRCGAPHIANELRRLANIARAVIKAVEGEKE